MRRSQKCLPPAAALLTALTLALTPALAAAAWSTDPGAGTPVAPGTTLQRAVVSLADGAGGAFIAWEDARPVTFRDIYVQHVLANGSIDPAWPSAGVAACSAMGNQTGIKMVGDGAGGVYLAWSDPRAGFNNLDVYLQRVTAAGAVALGWPANGLGVAATGQNEEWPSICSDGAGGVLVVWQYEYSPSDDDIYLARVNAACSIVYTVPVYVPVSVSSLPVIAPDGANGCYVAFQDYTGGETRVLAGHLNSAGNPVYSPTLFYVASLYDQRAPQICIDGSGGAFVGWIDLRNPGDADLYVSRIGPTSAPQQPFFGNAVRVATKVGAQEYLDDLEYDGAGAALVTWNEQFPSTPQRTYAQRVNTSAQNAPGWPAGGVDLGTGDSQLTSMLAPDGTGGAVVAWLDFRGGPFTSNVYGTRLTGAGAPAPRWASNGNLIAIRNLSHNEHAVCSDGRRGAIAAYVDYELDPGLWQIFVHRIDRYAALGDAEPRITSVRDVASDQGGKVRVTWNASYLDVEPAFGIGSYWVWRATPTAQAEAAVRSGARWVDETADAALLGAPEARAESPPPRLFRRAEGAAVQYAWEFLVSQPANTLAQYSYVAATTRDSSGGSNPPTAFMVEAHAASGPAFWASAPDSGYSVDNLAPAMPAPFTGTFTAGTTFLHWGRNTEADLAGYRLYRGGTAGFVPGPSNLIAAPPDTGYNDNGAAGAFYKLSAVDIHGNESPFASLGPQGTTDATPEVIQALWLGGMAPNPVTAGSLLRFALPRTSRVELAIHDAAGRRVRVLADAEFPAGAHEVRWDGSDSGGRQVQSGLYFIRMVANRETRRGRFAVLK